MILSSGRLPGGMFARRGAEAGRHAAETAAVILAGGRGTRLGALTRHECKPALPFGGRYRNIDFSLSNCVNSGIRRIGVATQYQDASLLRHLAAVWGESDPGKPGFIEPWRARAEQGYRGTADAVYRNWAKIERLKAQFVLILAGDHVYKMDYRRLLQQHVASGADITVGFVEIPMESAGEFGVMSIDGSNRILRFAEKPREPECLPGRPDRALGSMGIYVFNREFLGRILQQDAVTETSSHDFGRDLLPRLIHTARVFAYPFTGDDAVGGGYWRDVGTISAYWQAHMELLDGVSGLHLDDANWPVRSTEDLPEAEPFQAKPSNHEFLGSGVEITRSLLASTCRLDWAKVSRSVLSANVSVAPNTELSNAVVLPGARIGRNCRLADVVIGSDVQVPDGTVIVPMGQRDAAPEPALLVPDTEFVRSYGRVDRSTPSRNFMYRR